MERRCSLYAGSMTPAPDITIFCMFINNTVYISYIAFSALTLLFGQQEGHLARKKIWGDGGGAHWLVRMEGRPAG